MAHLACGDRSKRRHLGVCALVVMVDSAKEDYQQRDEDHYNPGASVKLGNGDDGHDYSSGAGAHQVHRQTPTPVRPAQPPPAPDHSALREGKGHKDPNRVEVNQRFCVAIEDNQQNCGEDAQNDDTGRESQTVVPKRKLMWQVAIAREQGREPWKICEARSSYWRPMPESTWWRTGRHNTSRRTAL
ncbi:MAG TPA: hypothetical protein VKR06_25275 [Ktedonosporobacter sp.]|nr:hypothetical protein [Ktedonosporobacter sp.]